MHLNHVHLAGPHPPPLRAFYEPPVRFPVKPMDEEDDDITFLVDEKGFLLALDAVPEAHSFPKWFHLGFCLDDPQRVRDLFARMKAGGVRFTRELTEYDGEATVFFC